MFAALRLRKSPVIQDLDQAFASSGAQPPQIMPEMRHHSLGSLSATSPGKVICANPIVVKTASLPVNTWTTAQQRRSPERPEPASRSLRRLRSIAGASPQNTSCSSVTASAIADDFIDSNRTALANRPRRLSRAPERCTVPFASYCHSAWYEYLWSAQRLVRPYSTWCRGPIG